MLNVGTTEQYADTGVRAVWALQHSQRRLKAEKNHALLKMMMEKKD